MKFTSVVAAIFLISLGTVRAVETKLPVDYVNPLIDTHKSRWIFFFFGVSTIWDGES